MLDVSRNQFQCNLGKANIFVWRKFSDTVEESPSIKYEDELKIKITKGAWHKEDEEAMEY